MQNYTALIIDLKRSRSYSVSDRNSIQNFIMTILMNLNSIFSESLAKNVDFSAGDEVQGLFYSSESAYLYLRLFNMLISPVEIRAGIGIGEWNVKVHNASTTAQDGPVYHNARKAIENVKNTVGYTVLMYSGTANDVFLNEMINTAFTLTSDHSEYQNELMLLSEMLYPVDCRGAIKNNRLNLLCELVTLKNKLDFYTCNKTCKSVKKYPFDMIGSVSEPVPADAADDDGSFYVSGGRKRGLTTQLSGILGISRQSIEKTFRTANIFEARNSAVAALKFMDKYL